MSYALEACDGTMSQRDICYRGADVINYYKIFYDETIGAGIPKNNGDALHYTFLRIKERYGWDVYKKAFRELYALGELGAGRARDALRQIPLLPLLRFEGRGRRCRGGDLYARGTGPDRGIA